MTTEVWPSLGWVCIQGPRAFCHPELCLPSRLSGGKPDRVRVRGRPAWRTGLAIPPARYCKIHLVADYIESSHILYFHDLKNTFLGWLYKVGKRVHYLLSPHKSS